QHAHQKGIIHRDLKPSNVLVALYDDKPVPKVIDFGVAKATEQRLTEQTLLTGFGAVVGTVEYMSPEQASLTQLDVDTRSDIYSLGVLLYELLTGTTPLERRRLQETGILEALRLIREEEAPTLSQRLSTTEELASIAARRGLEPAKLTKLVRGELNWIVMKALEKDRSRRYETANGLAMDLQRYLADEPVQACPPSMGYRLRKWSRRYKTLVRAAVVVLFLGAVLSAVSIGLIWQAYQAEVEARAGETNARHQAEANLELALEAMAEIYFKTGSARVVVADDFQQVDKEFLQKGLMFYEEFVRRNGGNPRVRFATAKAYFAIGRLRRDLGQHQQAERDLNQAIAMLAKLIEEGHPDPMCRRDLASVYHQRGMLREQQQLWPEAIADYRDALKRMETLATAPAASALFLADFAWMHHALAHALLETGELEEAHQYALRAIAHQKAALKVEKDQRKGAAHLAWHNSLLGNIQRQRGNDAEAESVGREAVKLFGKLAPDYGDHASGGINAHAYLAQLLHQVRRFAEAEEQYLAAIALARRVVEKSPNLFRPRHTLAWCYANLGRVRFDRDQLEEAEQALREAEALGQQLLDRFPSESVLWTDLARTLSVHGSLLQKHHRLKEAESYCRRSLKLWEEAAARGEMRAVPRPGSRRHRTAEPVTDTEPLRPVLVVPGGESAAYNRSGWAVTQYNLGRLLSTKGQLIDACKLWEQALGNQEAALELDPGHPEFLRMLHLICQALAYGFLRREEWGRAAVYFDKGCRVLKPAIPGDWLLNALLHLGAGDREGHRKICAEILKRFGDTKDPEVARVVVRACTMTPDAIADMSRLVPLAELALADRENNQHLLGAALYRAGKYKEAIACFHESAKKHGGLRAVSDGLYLAMAHHRLGEPGVARQYLDMVKKVMAKPLKLPPDAKRPSWYVWLRRIEPDQLLREAEALLGVTKKKD
ncbi:MAG: tetratricopeptide repeat protein, partial [Gemmataceae bacterium]|nr:tetratricopeptide repeat protein [Gemmataceae bacterium]